MLQLTEFTERTYHENAIPCFTKSGNTYTVEAKGGYAFGAFSATTPLSAVSEQWLTATVGIHPFGKGTRAMALLLFFDAEGKKLQSDFLAAEGERYEVSVRIPEGAAEATLELLCYAFDGGATFTSPTLTEAAPPKERGFRVAAAYIKREGSTEANLRAVLDLIDRAGAEAEKPDMICFTESVYDLGVSPNCYIKESSEVVARVRDAARRNAMYVLFTFHEEGEDGYLYNTALLLSGTGETVGKYRKVQPTLGELKLGIAPGTELPVFDLPFAKVGVLICWDQYFYETSRALVRKGAEVILWPSRGYHEERMLTRARDNGVYYVSIHPLADRCCVADPAGWRILARGEGESGYVTYRIDLNDRKVSEYKSFGKNGGRDREIYLSELRSDFY